MDGVFCFLLRVVSVWSKKNVKNIVGSSFIQTIGWISDSLRGSHHRRRRGGGRGGGGRRRGGRGGRGGRRERISGSSHTDRVFIADETHVDNQLHLEPVVFVQRGSHCPMIVGAFTGYLVPQPELQSLTTFIIIHHVQGDRGVATTSLPKLSDQDVVQKNIFLWVREPGFQFEFESEGVGPFNHPPHPPLTLPSSDDPVVTFVGVGIFILRIPQLHFDLP